MKRVPIVIEYRSLYVLLNRCALNYVIRNIGAMIAEWCLDGRSIRITLCFLVFFVFFSLSLFTLCLSLSASRICIHRKGQNNGGSNDASAGTDGTECVAHITDDFALHFHLLQVVQPNQSHSFTLHTREVVTFTYVKE